MGDGDFFSGTEGTCGALGLAMGDGDFFSSTEGTCGALGLATGWLAESCSRGAGVKVSVF